MAVFTDIKIINDKDQVKALASAVRKSILSETTDEPKTISQLARMLSLTPAAIHYHIKILEKVDFVKIVKTRKVNNNLTEKYYQSTLPPTRVYLHFEQPKRGPVPAKEEENIDLRLFAKDIREALDSIGVVTEHIGDEELEESLTIIIELFSVEVVKAQRQILNNIELDVKPEILMVMEGITASLISLTIVNLFNNPEHVVTLRSFVAKMRK